MEATWKLKYQFGFLVGCKCSNCQQKTLYKKVIEHNRPKYNFELSNYCPNCGYEMKAENLVSTAKWIETEDTYGGFVGFKCSECNGLTDNSNDTYCIHCGRSIIKE